MTDEQKQDDPKATAKASEETAVAEAETVRLVLVPDVFTKAFIAHLGDGVQALITPEGVEIPAGQVEEIIEQGASYGVILKTQEA